MSAFFASEPRYVGFRQLKFTSPDPFNAMCFGFMESLLVQSVARPELLDAFFSQYHRALLS